MTSTPQPQKSMETTIEEMVIFNEIRRYNLAKFRGCNLRTRERHQDAALRRAGYHAGLLPKVKVTSHKKIPRLKPDEREKVLNFLRDFCRQRGLEVTL